MKKMIKTLMALCLCTMLLAGCQSKSNYADSAIFKEMETVDLSGKEMNADYFAKNKLTLVNVWNPGCTPCIDEMPVFEKINQDYADKGVEIVGLLFDFATGVSEETRKEANQIVTDSKTTFPHITVSQAMMDTNLLQGITAFPTTYFVNAEGEIVSMIEGSNDEEGWKAKIDEILAQMEKDEK